MKISDKNILNLSNLIKGDALPFSKIKTSLIEELIRENVLHVSGKHKKTVFLKDKKELLDFFQNQYQINLEEYINNYDKAITRADFAKLTGDSKDSKERVFKGFLVNSVSEITALLNEKPFKINPGDGSFIFIYDFEKFKINENVTVVGVENSSNFRFMKKQLFLFKDKNLLFVSRYPQNQAKDLLKWLSSIPNGYLHFGDFDFAGIAIYLNEYKKYLGEKARFLVPKTIENDLKNHGNRDRYDKQKQTFKIETIDEPELVRLVKLIHKYKKGLDQEYYIK